MAQSILEESKKAKRGFFGRIFRRKYLIIIAILVVAAGAAYFFFVNGKEDKAATPQTKRATVQKEDLKIAIESEGKVVARDGVELSFPVSGNLEVEEVYVKEGDKVKKGDKIASVKTESLEFELRSAYSNYQSALSSYNDKVAGATDNEISKAKASVDQAQVSLDQAKISLENTKTSVQEQIDNAQIALEEAEDDYQRNQSLDNSETIKNAYVNLLSAVKSVDISLQKIRRDSDAILGIDESYLNDDFEAVLGAKDASSLNSARNSFMTMRSAQIKLSEALVNLNSSDYSSIENASDLADSALEKAQAHMYDMQAMLDNTITSSSFSQTKLDSFKSTISSDRSSINSSVSSLNNSNQTVSDARSNLNQYRTNYEKAVKALANAKSQGEQDIKNSEISLKAREISLSQAKLDYEDLLAPISSSDLASARSQLTSAAISVDRAKYNMEQATLTSPIDGVVSMLNYKTGDIILSDSAKSMATIINNDTLFIEVNIEESDISKLKIGQKAVATFEAVEGLELNGEVSFISLTSETNSNGIVTYLVRMAFDAGSDSQIREGMTAAVEFVISEAPDVLAVPVDAVRNVNNQVSVQKADGQYATVVTGFTDGKKVEIISGLSEGETVVY